MTNEKRRKKFEHCMFTGHCDSKRYSKKRGTYCNEPEGYTCNFKETNYNRIQGILRTLKENPGFKD